MRRNQVRAKKHLGQHFLKDESVSIRLEEAISLHMGYKKVLEIGPGTGALTKFLLEAGRYDVQAVEVDYDSIAFLKEEYPDLQVYELDFLKADLVELMGTEPFAVVGDFPYNISSQILFKVIDFKDQVPEVVGMFQKEVGERIAEKPGTKKYGVISVLLQAYYDIEYLFTVHEQAFDPPPRVKSGVIRLRRNNVSKLDCDEKLFKRVVKQAFNQRRKTMRNSLRSMMNPEQLKSDVFNLRPEQLSVDEFVKLTLLAEKNI
ncbi:MAG: 16S rRNA (adenine(1518)-N(6)/adenine(1519)-N(6))-dimethyltransferase RsmA [Flavobacteriales bacterium]|nr:16S rRNA (adenine(1518)-N(6)/adenine(1519)-N(6))-dimethyltransferase RsmA [Flavobacteriales bacterium]